MQNCISGMEISQIAKTFGPRKLDIDPTLLRRIHVDQRRSEGLWQLT